MVNFITGFVIGGAIVYFIMLMMRPEKAVAPDMKKYDTKQEEEKAKNLTKLREFVASSSDKITNDMVEAELNVSDATAERYLNELEKEGLVKQVGAEGAKVYYEKV